MVTAELEVETAVAAMRAGAYDYLTKPVDRDRLLLTVRRACERRRLVDRVKNLQSALGKSALLDEIVGAGSAMRELSRQVERVVESDVAVCLLGESGTGKELVTRAIHKSGPRRHGPFVAINCAAIPASLQETELFGTTRRLHGRDANAARCCERGSRRTLLLRDWRMSPAQAVRRTLQERTVRRGCQPGDPVDVRIVCATHRDLKAGGAGRSAGPLLPLVVYRFTCPAARSYCRHSAARAHSWTSWGPLGTLC